jgi:hypothetical protein
VTGFGETDGDHVGTFLSGLVVRVALAEAGELGGGVEETAEGLFVGLDEVLLFEVVAINAPVVVVPLVHHLIGMLGVVGGDLAVDKLGFGNLIVSGSVCSELRLDEQPVTGAVPGHVAFFVPVGHLNFIFITAALPRIQ